MSDERAVPPVRVRVAPSPTGAPHVGTAFVALFNLLFARVHGGKLLLRIEDTDQARSRPEHEHVLIEALGWLGLSWDEGPDVGGEVGPYRQSERLEIYHEHALQLVEAGHAYYSFATPDELDSWRSSGQRGGAPPPYAAERDGDPGAARERAEKGEPYVIRMKVPREGQCVVEDVLRDNISFELDQIDDQVLVKSDGFPTYHLAVVVDDHLMGVTHVIRGEEWINSTPKHLLLYKWFGWQPPQHAHLPLLLNPDRSKMSKRRNPTSIDFYRRAGFQPEALLNYLALMAYPPAPVEGGEGEEKFTLSSLADRFDLERINLGGSVFDLEKLRWLNGRYLREDMDPTSIVAALKEWAINDTSLSAMVPLMQSRMETLGDFIPRCAFFFASDVDPAVEDLVPKKRAAEEVAQILQTVVWSLEAVDPWESTGVEAAVRSVADYWDWPVRDVTRPLYAAIMGQPVGPPLFESIALLGTDISRVRLQKGVDLLGGVSKKKARSLEKAWTSRS
ncbi:MAG: glutamate--tRNA ligase [Candidatus Latescibacterota bacterium]|nr:glutamate--tRNA ligase [Candidatus Latescibacterota bacterium]